MPPDPHPDDRSRRAVELLVEELRHRLERHPWGHLLAGRRERVDLRLALPLNPREGELAAAWRAAGEEMEEGLTAVLRHHLIFRPGHVYCLRCARADCEHSAPRDPRQVFAGYGGTGLPRFLDLGQRLLEARDPRVDALYGEAPGFLTRVESAVELTAELLEAYRDTAAGHRLHGQVTAGWYLVPDGAGSRQPLAVTFQIASSGEPGGRRRYGLNVLGTGPGDEPLELLHDRLGRIPWAAPVRWAQEVLDTIERGQSRRRGKGRGRISRQEAEERRERRLEGLLGGLARRLEHEQRARGRRTRHAQQRHAQGDRPTGMAMADLEQARPDDLLFDVRRRTLVVLGEKGRAHFFNEEGKLVTSVRYSPPAIARRRERGLWRLASTEEAKALAGARRLDSA